ncbi:hypothetical protein [Herbidospora daliensis]|uniref:hypothetical protein n=1 Tax=Herbidospora daliensis TaxID=295585 RepID=UPI000B07FD13|nr:hypothetical protein [Herbidospora daliensis]
MGILKKAAVGLAIAGAAVSLTGTAVVGTASASTTMALKIYKGYPDMGNCNYWRSAVKATGLRVSACTHHPENNWYFYSY